MVTGYVWHPMYAWHDTQTYAGILPPQPTKGIAPGIHVDHPDTKKRMHELVEASNLYDQLVRINSYPLLDSDITKVHDPAMLSGLDTHNTVGGNTDGYSPWGPGGLDVARRAAGGTVASVEAVLDGRVDNAYALVRPAGHHARADYPMGFCLINNIAIGTARALEYKTIERVAIVDYDLHHGNGNEQIFWSNEDVLTISLHQDRNYPPGSGLLSDVGDGDGLGTNINVPLPPGTGDGGYLDALYRVVLPALDRFQPDLIIIASGFDASTFDPLGSQMLTADAYREMATQLVEAAGRICDGKLVASHEGGYNAYTVPFLGITVLEALSGIDSGFEDPHLPIHREFGQQELQPHQKQLVDEAAQLIGNIPKPIEREFAQKS